MKMLDDTRVETRKLYTRLAPRGVHLASGGPWFVCAGVCVWCGSCGLGAFLFSALGLLFDYVILNNQEIFLSCIPYFGEAD